MSHLRSDRTALQLDLPRERLDALGPEALSDGELLALLLRTGDRGGGVVRVAARLLATADSLESIARSTARELAAVPGVGPAKAATVSAAFEMSFAITTRAFDISCKNDSSS